jgi:hypothetical protein
MVAVAFFLPVFFLPLEHTPGTTILCYSTPPGEDGLQFTIVNYAGSVWIVEEGKGLRTGPQ